MNRHHSSEEGAAAVVELAIVAPIMLLLIWLILWAGSGGQTPGEARLAAQDAARLASTLRTADDRPAAATRLVNDRLDDSSCATWTTSTSSSDTAVTVAVTCTMATDQMAALRVPARTVTASGRAAIDPYFLQG